MTLRGRLAAVSARRDVRLLGIIGAVEGILVVVYFLATPSQVTRPRYVLYPFVWINAGLWAVAHTDLPSSSRRRQIGAGLLAAGYLFVLLVLAGLVGVDPAGNPAKLVGLSVEVGSPGWSRLRLVLPAAHLTLVPFRVVGYLALAFLVYATLLDAAAAAVTGALGLVSCLSCTFPILASLAAGLLGSSAVLTGALYAYSLDISTAVFLTALALLYYRPGFGDVLG